MFVLTEYWDLSETWVLLTITAKLYILCLFVSTIYVGGLLARTILNIQSLPIDGASINTARVRSRLIEMNRRIENLRQFHTLLFLLFGIFFANETFAALQTIQLSMISLSGARIYLFEPLAAFAFLVFVMLAFLHSFQWVVAASLRSKLDSI